MSENNTIYITISQDNVGLATLNCPEHRNASTNCATDNSCMNPFSGLSDLPRSIPLMDLMAYNYNPNISQLILEDPPMIFTVHAKVCSMLAHREKWSLIAALVRLCRLC